MHVHAICHVPYEGPALIGQWAHQSGHLLTTSLALTEELPPASETDMLIIMGGPMDADDEVASPWLVAEKIYVREAIDAGLPVLGVCLGAQILAEVIGGVVRRAEQPEIGWFPVGLTQHGAGQPLFGLWPTQFTGGHWHFDTFDLPAGVEPVLTSDVTPNQAFVCGDRVVGLQFHLEWTPETLADLVREAGGDLPAGPFVQDAATMVEEAYLHQPVAATLLFELLDGLAAMAPGVAR
jgi:GMP synthase-like glutamine amidotransferase